MQCCGDFSGESQPSQAPLPGFSAEQTSSIFKLIQTIFEQPVGPLQQPVQQPNPTPPSPPTPPPTQPISLAKKKRNQKTRQQHKRKQALRVTVQEVDHMQEVKLVQISVEQMASKHVVLQVMGAWAMTTSLHAVISRVGMTLFDGMIMDQDETIWRPRMGVG